jgi:ketosteroid isomerase-like protein
VREHPHAINVRAAFVAFGRGDLEAMARRFADDIVWNVGGRHALSGDYHGRENVINHLREAQRLAAGTLKMSIEDVLASDRYGAVIYRVFGKRNGHALDVKIALAIVFDDQGRWTKRFGLADDQRAVDEFWGQPA